MKLDLHLHSTASDGALPPRELVERAVGAGLDVMALTDHDTVDGVPQAMEAAAGRIRVVPAIEISAGHRGRDLHILGYFVDPRHPTLVDYGRQAVHARELRIRHMLERLAGLDIELPFQSVLDEAGPDASALARPHLARALMAGGHVASIAEAFDRYIGDEGPAFVGTELVDVPGAIALIHEAGGIAVWAHPPLPLLGDALRGFVDAGLDGLECHRPRVAPPDLNRLLNKARQHDLIVTGGSDWHGEWHGELGTFHVAASDVEAFVERMKEAREM